MYKSQVIIDFDKNKKIIYKLVPSRGSSESGNIGNMTRIYPTSAVETTISSVTDLIHEENKITPSKIVQAAEPTRFEYALLKRDFKKGDLPELGGSGRELVSGIPPIIIADIFQEGIGYKYQEKYGVLLRIKPQSQGTTNVLGEHNLLSRKVSRNYNTYKYIINGSVISTESVYSYESETKGIVMHGYCYYSDVYKVRYLDRNIIVTNLNVNQSTARSGIFLEDNEVKKFNLSRTINIQKNIYYKFLGEQPLVEVEETITGIMSPFISPNPKVLVIVVNDVIAQIFICKEGNIDSVDYILTNEGVIHEFSSEYFSGVLFYSLIGKKVYNYEPMLSIKVKDFDIQYFLKNGIGSWGSLLQILNTLYKNDVISIFENMKEINNPNDFVIRYGANVSKTLQDYLSLHTKGNASAYDISDYIKIKNVLRRKIETVIIPAGRNASFVLNNIYQKEEISESSSSNTTQGGGIRLTTYTKPTHPIHITVFNGQYIKMLNYNAIFSSVMDLITIAYNFKWLDEDVETITEVYEGAYDEESVYVFLSGRKLQPRRIVIDYIRQVTIITYSHLIHN